MYQDLDDIVFEDRHKAYGAYAFRKHYDNTLTKAFLIGVSICTILFFFFFVSSKTLATKKTNVKEDMVELDVSNMLINFGDNTNGKGIEEPKAEEGSPAPLIEEKIVKEEPPIELPKITKDVIEKPIPDNVVPTPTRSETKVATAKKVEKAKTTSTSTSDKKTESKTIAKGSIKKEGATGDGRGNAAIGNLLKGRGTNSGSQGTGTGAGNYGDLVGGDSDGDSKIGIDRKLVGFIPGTMGRGGAQPKQNCEASGSISISYTVDKAGNVVSANRSSGISDPCVSSTAIQWVKQYVKAEKAKVSSKGTYKIVF